MNNLMTLIRKDLMEQWRTKKILILAIIFLFIAISSPILAKITPEILKSVNVPGMTLTLPDPTYNDAIDQFIKNISQLALLAVIFIVAGAVSDEKSRKTLEILLTKPVSRTLFILSKFKSYFFSISAIFLSASIIFYLYTSSIFTQFNLINFAIVAISSLLYMLTIVSVTILASTLVKNSIVAGCLGFLCYVLSGIVFSLIQPLKDYNPGMILSNYKDVISGGAGSSLIVPTIVCVTTIIFFIIIAIISFRKQEIER